MTEPSRRHSPAEPAATAAAASEAMNHKNTFPTNRWYARLFERRRGHLAHLGGLHAATVGDKCHPDPLAEFEIELAAVIAAQTHGTRLPELR